MLHGQKLSRCRRALRWTLFAVSLASLSALVSLSVPRQPRWILRDAVNILGYGRDGQTLVTAAERPGDMPGERSGGPLQVRDLTDGQVVAAFFEDAAEVRALGRIPAYADALLLMVQPRANQAAELHVLDLTDLSTRGIAFPIPPGKRVEASFATRAPLTALRPYDPVGENASSEMFLLDLDAGRVLQRWPAAEDWCEPIFHERVFFVAHATKKKWTALAWDLLTHKAISIEKDLDNVYITSDRQSAVTHRFLPPSLQRIKLWDLQTGAPISERLTRKGAFQLSHDGAWAILLPEAAGHRPEVWNLVDEGKGKIREIPFDAHEDSFDVRVTSAGAVLLHESKSGLSAFDAYTFAPLWQRASPREGMALRGNIAHQDVIVLLDNDIEIVELASGETVRKTPLVDRAYCDGMLWPTLRAKNRLVVIGEFRPDGHAMRHRFRQALENWGIVDATAPTLSMAALIEFDTGRVAFQRQLPMRVPTLGFWVSDDAKRAVLSYHALGDQRVIECWDVPARRPWAWIVGIPLGVGAATWLGRWAWRSYGRRRAKPQAS